MGDFLSVTSVFQYACKQKVALLDGVSNLKMLIGSQAIPWAIRQRQHSLTTVNPYFTII